MPTNKPEVVLPEAPPIPAHMFDKDQSIVWAAAWETLRKHIADTLTRPAAGDAGVTVSCLAGELPALIHEPHGFSPDYAGGWNDAMRRVYEVTGIKYSLWEMHNGRAPWPAPSGALSAAPQQHGQEVVGTPYRCDYCGADYGARACCDMRYEYLRKFGENILPPLSAQQPAEAVAGFVDSEQLDDLKRGECVAIQLGTYSRRYRRTLPVYTSPPPAIDIGKLRENTHRLVAAAAAVMPAPWKFGVHVPFLSEKWTELGDAINALIGDGGEKGNG